MAKTHDDIITTQDTAVMAEESGMDMPAHVDTYGRVMTMLKWGAVACFLVGALVVWLIA